jgi:hypothetical protein
VTAGPDIAPPRVAILAEDLIWATRLGETVRRAGGVPVTVRATDVAAVVTSGIDGLVVDLTARGYDGTAALDLARSAGVPSVAVGQHDDAALRRAAREAGAGHVYAYRALFENGDRHLGAWVAALGAGTETRP